VKPRGVNGSALVKPLTDGELPAKFMPVIHVCHLFLRRSHCLKNAICGRADAATLPPVDYRFVSHGGSDIGGLFLDGEFGMVRSLFPELLIRLDILKDQRRLAIDGQYQRAPGVTQPA
jgi:hypothetical protein